MFCNKEVIGKNWGREKLGSRKIRKIGKNGGRKNGARVCTLDISVGKMGGKNGGRVCTLDISRLTVLFLTHLACNPTEKCVFYLS